MFNKITTILVSERVFDIVSENLEPMVLDGTKISGYLECFNNCREQGYVLQIYSTDYKNEERTKETLYVWAFQCRNSDEIVVSWQKELPGNGMMFSEVTYKERRKYFKPGEYQQAANFITKLVKDHFKKEFERSNY